jgi:GDP-L-fucose synthase
MNKTKIYIAGHNGMVGSAIWRTPLKATPTIGFEQELDLRNQQAVKILWLPKTGS